MAIALKRFRVSVADRNTGGESTIEVDAISPATAETVAQERGWLVTKVEEIASAPSSNVFIRPRVIVGVLFVLIGLAGLLLNNGYRYSASDFSAGKFDGMYAPGASANSLERIERNVNRIRDSVDSLHRSIVEVQYIMVIAIGAMIVTSVRQK